MRQRQKIESAPDSIAKVGLGKVDDFRGGGKMLKLLTKHTPLYEKARNKTKITRMETTIQIIGMVKVCQVVEYSVFQLWSKYSSLHWSFSCFSCRFSSTGVCSDYTSPFHLHHSYLFCTFQKERGPTTY